MARQLRSVQQVWGPSINCAVTDPVGLLCGMALLADCRGCDTAKLGDSTVVRMKNGRRFLDLIEADDFPARSLMESRDRGVRKIRTLCLDMKALAPQWRHSISADGSLLFSIDVS